MSEDHHEDAEEEVVILPQILNRAAVTQLTADLDSGDGIECYLLTRVTPLHTPGLANDDNSGALKVTKQALGLRYRPPLNAASMHAAKNPLELTLEYGPARAGLALQQESIPRVIPASEDNGESAFVTWDNQGRVYYTTESISASATFETANYVASLNGAVLENLLWTAVEYAQQHRRYQPFAVYRDETLLLRSSSPTDFIDSLWQHLANVGVELAPLIQPVQWQVRLQADAVDKVQSVGTGQGSVSRTSIADFYTRFFDCIKAVATADYSAYDENPVVTTQQQQPSQAPSSSGAVAATLSPTAVVVTVEPTSAPRINLNEGTTTSASTDNNSNNNNGGGPRRRQLRLDLRNTRDANEGDGDANKDELGNDDGPSAAPSDDSEDESAFSDSAQAAQAAAEAAQAADQADQAGNAEAANAAHAAANAAQKAADVTASQAATIAMDALVHGDGPAMAEAASVCLDDPVYGIAPSDGADSNATTTAYLYWDGSFYYRVNLTAPYIRVVPLVTTMPRTPRLDISDGGDMVDWSLELLILALFTIFIFLLVQQLLGRKFSLSRPLYEFQRWFFDPLHCDHDDDMSDDELRGIGQAYSFGEDVIPLSMGGRKPASPQRYSEFFPAAQAWPNGSHGGGELAELEMTERLGSPGNVSERARISSIGSAARMGNDSFHSYDSDEADIGDARFEEMKNRLQDDIPVRLVRDPDLVDLPHLRSSSKVAIPVSLVDGSSHSATSTPTTFHR